MPNQRLRDILAPYASAADLVLGIAVLVGLGAWGGFWLDEKIHTTPWLAIILSLTGMGLGLARMVLKAMKAEKDN